MIEKLRDYPSWTVVFLVVVYLVGAIGLSWEYTRPIFLSLVPFNLLLSLYFLWLFNEQPTVRFYLASVGIFLAGFFVEVAGVNTGVIFGEYAYGRTLGLKIFETPLMIGVNWLMLVYCTWVLSGYVVNNRWIRYLLGGLTMVLYDVFLEPVAIRLDMWTWAGEDIPLRNYIAWFVISVVLLVVLDLNTKTLKNKIAPSLFIIQFLFFIALSIVFHFI